MHGRKRAKLSGEEKISADDRLVLFDQLMLDVFRLSAGFIRTLEGVELQEASALQLLHDVLDVFHKTQHLKSTLPSEILQRIFQLCDSSARKQLRLVNKSFRNIVDSTAKWRMTGSSKSLTKLELLQSPVLPLPLHTLELLVPRPKDVVCPPSVRALVLQQHCSLEWLATLPPLQSLTVRQFDLSTAEFISKIPRSITTLEVEEMEVNAFPMLPPRLEALSVSYLSGEVQVPQLPPTIKRLCGLHDLRQWNPLPDNLHYLHFNAPDTFEVNWSTVLPQKPPVEIHIKIGWICDPLAPDAVKIISSYPSAHIELECGSLTLEHVQNLPASTHKLTIGRGTKPPAEMCPPPPHLKTVQLFAPELRWFEYIPQNLECLTINFVIDFNEDSWGNNKDGWREEKRQFKTKALNYLKHAHIDTLVLLGFPCGRLGELKKCLKNITMLKLVPPAGIFYPTTALADIKAANPQTTIEIERR